MMVDDDDDDDDDGDPMTVASSEPRLFFAQTNRFPKSGCQEAAKELDSTWHPRPTKTHRD